MFSSAIESVHFTGIGGTAMASAAAAMQDKGFRVTGSDQNVYEPMASFLASKKIAVMNGYDERNLAHKPDLVIIGNAISRGNPEAEFVLDHKLRYTSLPALLAEFFIRGKRSLVVTGTHGKTTTTSLLTWVFEHNGFNPSYLIGGIPNNFSQGARFTDSEWFIIEGDEYDTAFFDKRSKFIHYQPEVAIINNLEFDHADIFENLNAIKKTFIHFIRLVPRNGLLLGNGDDPNLVSLLNVTHCPVKRFGLGADNAVQGFNLRFGPTATEFEIPSFKFHLNLVGELNVRNALAVIGAAKHCGLSNKQIQSAFDTFKGIKRRMEIKGHRLRGVTGDLMISATIPRPSGKPCGRCASNMPGKKSGPFLNHALGTRPAGMFSRRNWRRPSLTRTESWLRRWRAWTNFRRGSAWTRKNSCSRSAQAANQPLICQTWTA